MTTTLRTAVRSLRRAVPAAAVATAAALPLLLPTPARASTTDVQLYVWATGVNVRDCPGSPPPARRSRAPRSASGG